MRVRSIASVHMFVASLAFGAFSLDYGQAQSPPAKGSTDASSAPTGFSIESEMLTYRAMESNTQAIACDIAAYLNGATANFTNPPPGSICDVKAGVSKARVILLPFGTSEFADFQIWRADMASMDRLQRKAEVDCPTKLASKGATSSATSAASTLLSMSPAGPPLALAQSALALMAAEESSSSVGGTIQDQAFMNGVGRELRALSVPVLMPTAYTPYSSTPLDESNSPFLASWARTLAARGCLAGIATKDETKNLVGIQGTISDIDAFLDTLRESSVSPSKSTPAQAAKLPGESSAAQTSAGTQGSAGTAASASSSHLNAVLLADGLAQKLGVDPDTGTLPESGASQHILLVKALESGGSVFKNTNILGTRIRYSGGSVGTYALFTTDGDLECSGNVYEYGGSLSAKDFERDLRKYSPEPARQRVFLHGSCRPPARNR